MVDPHSKANTRDIAELDVEDSLSVITNAQILISHCVTRLSHCHEQEIQAALKQYLSRDDLISFIDYLRTNLADGGWLSRYIDQEADLDGLHQPTDHMFMTAKLLNCAVDSLGTSAWLGSIANDMPVDQVDTISYMKAEISAALEGIEEAAYLEGILQEVLLFSKTISQRTISQPPRNNISSSALTDQGSALPIGLKAKTTEVGLVKVINGGEIQARSLREMGKLKSMQVGPYTFEQIRI